MLILKSTHQKICGEIFSEVNKIYSTRMKELTIENNFLREQLKKTKGSKDGVSK